MITSSEMRMLEDKAEKDGLTRLRLMENAGLQLADLIKRRYGPDFKYLIVCGSGNNGGDGFVLARHLRKNSYEVKVLFLGKEKSLKKESGYNYYFLKDRFKDIFTSEMDEIETADVIVDAMLGIGVKGDLREPYASAVDVINSSGKKVIAVDIPTGLDPDTGKGSRHVNAELIITFHDIKPGLERFQEKVVVADIGL